MGWVIQPFIVICFIFAITATYFFAGYLAYEKGAGKSVDGDQLISGFFKTDGSQKDILKKSLLIALVFTAILFVHVILLKFRISPLKPISIYCSLVIIWTLTHSILELAGIKKFGWLIGWLLRLLIPFLITYGWNYYPNYLTINLTAFLMTLWFLIQFRNIRLIQLIPFLIGILIYDAVAVFKTEMMQAVAKFAVDRSLPMLFIVPASFSLSSQRFFGLGMGDVIFPGLIIMIGIRKAKHYKNKLLGILPMIGYIIGLLATLAVLFLTRFPQPATIYLFPFTLAGLFLAAWITGVKKKIFEDN